MTIAEYIEQNGVTMAAERIDSRPDQEDWWNNDPSVRHFKCVLIKRAGDHRRSMIIYFSQGSGHTEDPTTVDVLDCLASDSFNADEPFEYWCSEYGYDSDSRKAWTTYNTCVKVKNKLERWAGDTFGTLLECDRE